MLFYLFKYLETLNFPGARMFGYVSFRSLMAIILALLISAIFGEYFIKMLKRKQISETQRELLTFSMLVSLGGCESQVKGHIAGNANIGNDKATLLAVVTQLLP